MFQCAKRHFYSLYCLTRLTTATLSHTSRCLELCSGHIFNQTCTGPSPVLTTKNGQYLPGAYFAYKALQMTAVATPVLHYRLLSVTVTTPDTLLSCLTLLGQWEIYPE